MPFDRNRSGQFLYFGMLSALSGNTVAGIASGNISGRVALDGAAPGICAGPVIEDAGGQYHLNIFAADINGDNCGYFFTASGCVAVSISIAAQSNVSGKVYPASGANVIVPTASISGTIANSGLFVSVPIATLSGVVANSGLNVTVPIATISGTNAVVPTATLSGLRIISGASVLGTIYSGQLSGQNLDLTSGFSYPASGVNAVVAPATLSGLVVNSGLNVTVLIATISGANTVVPIASVSGINVVVPPSTLSGVVTNSGLSVIIPPANLSGVFASVPIASISGTFIASGQAYLASGSVFKNTFASGILAVEIPYGILKADQSGVTGEAQRSQINANRKLTNKWDLGITSSGIFTVFKEDDATVAYTQNVTTSSGSLPIGSLDTV